jgi:hypothetical protein
MIFDIKTGKQIFPEMKATDLTIEYVIKTLAGITTGDELINNCLSFAIEHLKKEIKTT